MPIFTTHRRRTARHFTLLALTGGLLLVACGDDDDTDGAATTTAPNAGEETTTTAAPESEVPVTELAITAGGAAGEYAFSTDLTTIEAGRVRVTLTNEGAEEHQAMLVRMNDGVDLGAIAAASGSDPSGVAVLNLVAGYGGPNAARSGGGTSVSTQDLEPGNYLLACLIPSDDGVPHASKGMVRPFTVTAPATPSEIESPPPADGEASLLDFAFVADSDLEAGSTVAVTNDGDQGHELVMYELEGDATIADVTAALEDPAGGPPPMLPAAGLGIVRPGGTVSFQLPDQAGRYALLCFLPDVAGDSAPHFAKGMATELEIS